MGDYRKFHSEVATSTTLGIEKETDVENIDSSEGMRTSETIVVDQKITTPESFQGKDVIPSQIDRTGQVILEAVNQNPYDLSYTCLLIPRFDAHYLMGDIADNLQIWMKQICISFGWHLEYISIKPDYLQWVLRVPPATSTAYFMRVVRQQTSLFIFEEFPRYKRENLSKDFWAPGYLIYFGSQPHPVGSIERYIRQTRQHQGILPDV